MELTLILIGAYLLGSISFAVIMSKIFTLPDPRTYGSGNPGATNVLRTGKKLAAALTLLGDALKGWVAVFLAIQFLPEQPDKILWVGLVALVVFLGHLFPVFLRFKGGKGVATALGVLLALNPWLGLGALVIWLFVALGLKVSSLAALAAALFTPIIAWLLSFPTSWMLVVIVMCALLIWRHKSNISNLLSGRETKIGNKTEAAQSTSDGDAA